MKTLIQLFAVLIFLSGTVSNLQAQKVSDKFPVLATIKKTSEDYARTIQLEWNHDAPEYRVAQNHYTKVKNGVDLMIQGLESKVRSGKNFKGKDLDLYLPQIQADLDAFAAYYVNNSHKAGANAALGLKGLLDIIKGLGKEFGDTFNAVDSWLDAQKAELMQERLKRIQDTLYPYKLAAWNDILKF